MNPFKVNFQELYERHLCRHSQYGINVIHAAAVLGIYLALAGIIFWIVGTEWLLLFVIIPYLVVVASNVPWRILLGTVLFTVLFLALFLYVPKLPWWVYVLAIPVFYKIQAWSHKVYNVEKDMIEFNKKYKKGFALFVLLSIYEIPLLLNYLIFDKDNWPTWLRFSRTESPNLNLKRTPHDAGDYHPAPLR
ncbi:MAG TPA: hypothetical protein VH592_11145 [Gemmataceae bacterium]